MTPIVRKTLSLAALGACFVATVATEAPRPPWTVYEEQTPEAIALTHEAPSARRRVTMRVTPGESRDASERVFSSLSIELKPTFTPDPGLPNERAWLQARLTPLDRADGIFVEEIVRVDEAGAMRGFTLDGYAPNECTVGSGCTLHFQLDVERDPYSQGTVAVGWKLSAASHPSTDAGGDTPAGMKIELTVE